MKKDNGKKVFEFSKAIFIYVSILTTSIVIYSCVMMAITLDLTPLAYLVPAVFAEFATATGYYFWKAKAENKIKLMKENHIEPDSTSLDN